MLPIATTSSLWPAKRMKVLLTRPVSMLLRHNCAEMWARPTVEASRSEKSPRLTPLRLYKRQSETVNGKQDSLGGFYNVETSLRGLDGID